jgi:hypothetical protein
MLPVLSAYLNNLSISFFFQEEKCEKKIEIKEKRNEKNLFP